MAKVKSQTILNKNSTKHEWTFLSNHSLVLLHLYRKPDARLRDLALEVGITERAIVKIVEDLELAGVLIKIKEGRRNKYKINKNVRLRHQLKAHKTVGDLLDLLK
ncbi:MAG: MarR family transcriptional regulator [Leptospiraceae bacterium]|nr:MarR family transcriptional regulator [Leptospiraceae bacterium]MCP5494540.1 MarR family transcriptional regulator [Leptospiraceae bacterium]